ncbi:hypothetical protein A9993_07755 [Rahnella victoriana]|uniref:hypothetical protein n=1 Tax=Rahnella victoriana TaxID=1510570 RepID=UPI000BB1F5FD|nr:hypothetical protein [Rahnella victoriana]PBI79639.1 hypothetical protein A9993_07755 [Rahnella victoriana]
MELAFVTPVQQTSKLQFSITTPPISILVDLPEDVNAENYFMVLTNQIANDIRVLSSRVTSVDSATMTLDYHFDLLGDEMSERIAKIETSIEHLVASINAMDAKLTAIVNITSDIKAGNAAIIQNFVEYDKKLDKKPSKDEVESKITGQANKQILWSITSLLVIIGIASSIIVRLLK